MITWRRIDRFIRNSMHKVHDWVGWPFQWFLKETAWGHLIRKNTTPNFWSIIRLPIAIFVGVCLNADLMALAITLFALAVLTDRLDGEMARLDKKESSMGMVLDTVSDSALLTATLLGLSHHYLDPRIPQAVVFFEGWRLVSAALIWVLPIGKSRERGLAPNMSGKFKMGAIALSVLAIVASELQWAQWLIDAAVGFSIWSMVRHLYDLRRIPQLSVVERVERTGTNE